ncbi:Spy/CpxP family protein refolding chaperone [Hydrogenispora ethanolica]|uniref:Spy/CpxP family protein refolding chaperone n=1 Tax=Hydrogenispora ethanolica TaxID=1082276 RepID=A0A4R1S2E0_HYDET|nr:Spy/CpxP family protein refolding chaperone [Hydrogenispora ethanolica]TCL73346.1 Spy/CpxP family protein refolding chaperone [Hydrogenispora ethanolica]
MKKSLLVLLTVALLIGSLSFAALAAGPGQGNRPAGEYRFTVFKALNLSPEQQEKLLAIRQDFEKATLDLRFDLQRKQLELRKLWAANPLDQNAIETQSKAVAALRVQMVTQSRAMFEKVKSVLTPAQLKQLETRFQDRPGKGRRGPGAGIGGPRRGGMQGFGFLDCPMR